MRYFTKRIWLGWQEDEPQQNWTALFERNTEAYHRQLRRLKGRLSSTAFRFFTHHTLHDGRLISIGVHELAPDLGQSPRTHVELQVVSGSRRRPLLYTLRYGWVSKIILDAPSSELLFGSANSTIGDWGYDELTAASPRRLRHEVLFHTGSTLLLEFLKFSFSRERLRTPTDAGRRALRWQGGRRITARA